ncbi:MAG TPA: hypothetical protein VGV63_05925 [Acidimicrobiales bacterium]|nr:hypothetical protein [Acidimicrobiales bacterium]
MEPLPISPLTHVITVASLTALVRRGVRWRRTNKSKSRSQGWAALQSVRAELLLGLGCLGTSAVMLVLAGGGGMATLLAIGLAVLGVTYLAAPIVVGISE